MDTSAFPIILLVFVLILNIVYFSLRKNYKHCKKNNVPCFSDPVTGFGNFWPVISLKENIASYLHKIYNSTDASMIGFYVLQKPSILLRDPELVKSVLLTNFKSFHDNLVKVNEKHDPARAKNPFLTRGYDQWKTARARVLNHFSSQKLRFLFEIVQDVSSRFSSYIGRKIAEKEDGVLECELRKLLLKFTGEIVANAALAMEGQMFDDNPHELSFAKNAATIHKPTVFNGVKQVLLLFLPNIAKIFGIRQVKKETDKYFRENLKAAIKERRKSNIVQNDFLQFCMDGNAEDDLDSIVADTIIFYIDVIETTSSAASSVLYFLANNSKVQKKLRDHLQDVLKETGGNITYESLKNMNYLDQVMKESLRLIPPLSSLNKICTSDITLSGPDGLESHLKTGDLIFISTMGLHMNPQYYPEPEIFDPERFSPENTANRNKYLFLPFNEGPRMCPGMRFSMILLKHSTATLISKFSLENSSITAEPLEFEPKSLITQVKGGLWAKFKKLN